MTLEQSRTCEVLIIKTMCFTYSGCQGSNFYVTLGHLVVQSQQEIGKWMEEFQRTKASQEMKAELTGFLF